VYGGFADRGGARSDPDRRGVKKTRPRDDEEEEA
jgi:hypothetical protein